MREVHKHSTTGPFWLDACQVVPEECLIRLGEDVPTDQRKVTPRAMDVLIYLAAHPSHVVSSDELLNELWNGKFASPNAVQKCIFELRHALGDDARHPTILQTIPKRGYKLLPSPQPIEQVSPNADGIRSQNKEQSGKRPAAIAITVTLLIGVGTAAFTVTGLKTNRPETGFVKSETAHIAIRAPDA